MFEFLFKYRPVAFQKGDLALGLPTPALLVVGLLLASAAFWLLRSTSGERHDRLVLGALRALALAVLAFCLLQPALLVSTVVPRRNFVGLLIDDSRSMQIADLDGERRAHVVERAFGSPTDSAPEAGAVRRALEERFQLRFFRFSDLPRRTDGTSALTFLGSRTDLAAALDGARQELAGLPLSGFVLVSDGAHNGEGVPEEAVLPLRSAGVPVYTVGVGRREVSPDVELQRVELPRSVLRGSTVVADVVLAHRGLSGRRVHVDVEDEGRILATSELELASGRQATATQVQFTAGETGARRLTFHVRPEADEALAGNNARDLLLEVRSERRKILYFEGEPRFEIKFLRRAVADDPGIQVVTLLRSAEDKFLRLDVDGPEELAAGFPDTREELFAYDGLVLGSVEASFFTGDQLRMIAEFVSRRGGGLVTLGGRRALAEGGYAGTPVADALPLRLPEESGEGSTGIRVATLRPALTPAGRRHPAVRLAEGEKTTEERWTSLPAVTSPNRVGEVKPGAVTLLSGVSEEGDRRPLLVFQRFGRGVAVAFPVQDTWLWQMHADVPLDDETHETLWRQLLRWLVSGVPGRLRAEVRNERVAPGGVAVLRAEVHDERFLRMNRASVIARVTGPTGLETEVPLEWTLTRDGEYAGSVRPLEEGLHKVRMEATGPEGDRITGTTYFDAAPLDVEHFEAGMNEPLLREIARQTGGRFYEPESLDALAEEIVYTQAGDTVIERKPIWDMPVLFLLLIGLMGAEWSFRRSRGLA